ncbi:MAG TPA: chromosome segregation protein SMC [Burkholderiales bacterium]|nr:chromosome segregation protein SMC [Burkholderiales bacterium]
MRLTQIKLAGFKSFVDPTHIALPGQVVGIVGPNGSGKSNIIDAVRWVLGETSARQLRGETMQDVLFNGSGGRVPVNRASVELIFDNSLGRAAGQWSQYAEISVKRVIQRDGESSYHINNTHVRRRDVADIFLGTGLASRAYAILEQGIISRVVEAKPEELRLYLEEAAGVSKYRERRRETELRLADTRDNLQRVGDILQELDKQLVRLEAQAGVAQQYHALQAQLQTAQRLLWLTKKNEAQAARARHLRDVEKLEIELEAATARLRDAEKRLEELRAEHYTRSDALHAEQGALYEVNAEVARLEQSIEHARDGRERIEHQLTLLRTQQDHNRTQIADARHSLDEWRERHAQAQATAETCRERVAAENVKLPLAVDAHRAAQEARAELLQRIARTEQELQVARTRHEHAQKTLQQLAARGERLNEERAGLQAPDTAALEQLRERGAALEADLQARRAALARSEQALADAEQALRQRTDARDAAAQEITAMTARREALQQLQERLAHEEKLQAWLGERGLSQASRLWQNVRIESGWEDALEAVLRERLNALQLGAADDITAWLDNPPPGKLTVYAGNGEDDAPAAEFTGLTPLATYVTCRDPGVMAVLREWLHQVYVAADAAAFERRRELPAGALLVSRDGHVFTRHSVSFYAPDSEIHGVLARQREIEELDASVTAETGRLAELEQAVAQGDAAIAAHKSEIASLRTAANELQQQRHAAQIEALRASEQAQRITARHQQIDAELGEIATQTQAETAQQQLAEQAVSRHQDEMATLREQAQQADEHYAAAETDLNHQRQATQQAEREHREATFNVSSCDQKINEIDNSIEVISRNQRDVDDNIGTLVQEQAEYDETPFQQQLQQALERRREREQKLAAARDALEDLDTRLNESEQTRLREEQSIDPLRNRIGDVRLKEQEARLVEEQFAQQLADSGAQEEELLPLLEKGMRSNALQSDINRLNAEIEALGAVNLAALDELQTARERKAYLDSQAADLTEAMTTLEDAIRRIDRETRERLQQTFDAVNHHFSEVFPTLFGGGQARLVLTGEEILDSGVQIIAQPPGKKNSTIHVLSGGEKALVALALVFALFQLNPAPFCILDEVDAPLDDPNTERFCNLVRRLSGESQFLIISHNKLTMEVAQQLVGITMQEPGVSRVVTVDIEEAMKLTAAAA